MSEGRKGASVTSVFIGAPRETAEIRGLTGRLRVLLLEDETGPLVCDLSLLSEPDCGTVDALARLQLSAGRLGHRISLQGVTPRLHELFVMAGLCDAVGCGVDHSGASGQREDRPG